MWAAWNNQNPEVLEVLVKAGAEVNAQDTDGVTPLMKASSYNQKPKILEVLLNAGANVRIKDKNGKTVWDYLQENEKLKGTEVYWKINDARFKN